MKLLYLFLLIPFIVFSQVINYGFEDYTGDVETTPGYIYTTSAAAYWSNHIHSTEVVSTCNGLTAYAGTYFLHRQFWTGGNDVCLGETSESINDHGNMGLNGSYPQTAYGDNTSLLTAITSDTMTIRFAYRLNGWKPYAGIMNWCKFLRVYGAGLGTNTEHALIYMYPENDANSSFGIWDVSIQGVYAFNCGTDAQDGNWHTFVYQIIFLNRTNTYPNLNVRMWNDDWNMTGEPFGQHTTGSTEFGSVFQHFCLTENFSNSYPSSLMSADFDNIQVWNGSPVAGGDTPNDTYPPIADGDISRPSDYQLRIQVSSISADVDTVKILYPDSSTVFKTQYDNTALDTTWTVGTGFDEWKYLYFWAVDDSGNVTHPSTLLDTLWFGEPNPPGELNTKITNVQIRKE